MHTKARHTFYPQMMGVHINQQFRQVMVLKVTQAPFLWLVSEAYQASMDALGGFKWLHLSWTSRQPAVIYQTTG